MMNFKNIVRRLDTHVICCYVQLGTIGAETEQNTFARVNGKSHRSCNALAVISFSSRAISKISLTCRANGCRQQLVCFEVPACSLFLRRWQNRQMPHLATALGNRTPQRFRIQLGRPLLLHRPLSLVVIGV